MHGPPPDLPPPPQTAQPPRPPRLSWLPANPHYRYLGGGSLQLLSFRPSSSHESARGYAIAGGESFGVLGGGFIAGGSHETELKWVPHEALSLTLSRLQLEAGPRLGPLLPVARVGFSLVHVDVGERVSFGMFSPRVGAALWLTGRTFDVGVSVFSEYVWRWVGSPSGYAGGLALELRVAKQKPEARALAPGAAK
jgi:hypothetical protein